MRKCSKKLHRTEMIKVVDIPEYRLNLMGGKESTENAFANLLPPNQPNQYSEVHRKLTLNRAGFDISSVIQSRVSNYKIEGIQEPEHRQTASNIRFVRHSCLAKTLHASQKYRHFIGSKNLNVDYFSPLKSSGNQTPEESEGHARTEMAAGNLSLKYSASLKLQKWTREILDPSMNISQEFIQEPRSCETIQQPADLLVKDKGEDEIDMLGCEILIESCFPSIMTEKIPIKMKLEIEKSKEPEISRNRPRAIRTRVGRFNLPSKLVKLERSR